jgi:hypothetical protein
MRARVITPLVSAIAAVLIGCNATAPPLPASVGAASRSPTEVVPSATSAATPSPSTVAVSSPTPSVFTSDRYGYVVSLPAPWALSYPASTTWDGIGSASHEGSYVDQFTAPAVVAWAVAAPTKLTLAEYVTHTEETSAAEHGCPKKPDADEPFKVGGEPGRLLTLHCGILVLIAITIHNGSAVSFAFQSPFGHSNTDAADRALFLSFLKGIRFTS